MRIERNLSQDGLASLLPTFTRGGKTTKRTSAWVSNLETGKNEPAIADLVALADVLQVSVGWLVTGDESGETEFVTRLRGMESLMDERGRREVLATAQRQVEENNRREAAMRRLLEDPEIQARYEELLAEEVASREQIAAASA